MPNRKSLIIAHSSIFLFLQQKQPAVMYDAEDLPPNLQEFDKAASNNTFSAIWPCAGKYMNTAVSTQGDQASADALEMQQAW